MTNSRKTVISPTVEEGFGYIFNVAGKNFKITGSHIQESNYTSEVFNNLLKAKDLFEINENGVTFYYDFKNKSVINNIEKGSLDNFDKFNELSEKLDFLNEEAKKLRVSGKKEAVKSINKEIKSTKDSLNSVNESATTIKFHWNKESYYAGKIEFAMAKDESLTENVFAAGYIKYEDKSVFRLFELAAENFKSFVELDFVKESVNNDIKVYTMKAENNVFIYRVNETTKISQFKKLLADAAVEYVAEQTGDDITELVESLLESLSERRAAKNEKINLYNEMLSFLHDQVGRLAEADRNLPDIKAADNLLKSEIKRISEVLSTAQNEDILDIEDGYVSAQLKVESDGYPKDQVMRVDALEYNNAGKNDILTVFIKDEPARIEKFKIALDSKDAF
jgi:hypothetical protein